MKNTIIIDGGAGRTIAAIPAIETFLEKNPDTLVVCSYWTPLLFGNPKIQKNLYDDETKGLFKLIKDTKILKPEPYYNSDYLNGKISLIEAFNQELNGTTTFNRPKVYITPSEINSTHDTLSLFQKSGPIIAFQPFGSAAVCVGDQIKDETGRSLSVRSAHNIVQELNKVGNVLVLVHSSLQHLFANVPCVYVSEQAGIRYWAALVSQSKYVVGIDSVVQHLGFAFEKPGSVIVGNTIAKNVSYPEWFTIFEKNDEEKEYVPYRLCSTDAYLANILNVNLVNYTETEIIEIANTIVRKIKQL